MFGEQLPVNIFIIALAPPAQLRATQPGPGARKHDEAHHNIHQLLSRHLTHKKKKTQPNKRTTKAHVSQLTILTYLKGGIFQACRFFKKKPTGQGPGSTTGPMQS